MAASVVSRAVGIGALTAAGQLLIIATLPLYSRLFDPGAYGEYVIFVGAVAVVGVFAGVRYDSAIVLPRSDRVALALSALVMCIALIVAGLIASAALLAQAAHWGPRSSGPLQQAFAYGLAAATVVGALQRCLSSWCVRSGRFLLMGVGQFVFCLVTLIAQLALFRILDQLAALVWGYVCALLFQTATLATLVLRLQRPGLVGAVSAGAIRLVARKYRRFPAYMVGYALASSARDRLIQIALGIGAGAAVVGRFGLAYRVAFAPNSLIYSSVSPIFFAIASRGTRPAVGRFAAGLVEATFVALVVPYVAVAVEAPALADELLSQKWHGTGPYLQALTGPALMLAATCWLDRAFDSFRRQNVAFALEATFTVVSVSLIGVLGRVVGPVIATWAFAALAIIYYWTYFLLVFVACGFPLAEFRRACVTGGAALAVALALGVAIQRLPGLQWQIAGYLLLAALVLVGWTVCGGRSTLRLLMQSRVGDAARS